MEKLSCESLVKWRTTSSSLTSGSIGACLRRRFSGMSAATAFGRRCSVGHWPYEPRVGREYSKMIFSGCLSIAMWFSPSGRAHGGFESFGQRIGVGLDVGRGARLGGADQQRVAELGVVDRQVEAADDAAARQLRQHRRDRAVEQQHGLVEARLLERQLHALDARQRRDQLLRVA